PVGTALGFADGGADTVTDLGSECRDRFLERRRALGERLDCAVLRARLGGQCIELGAGASERFEEMGGTLIAMRGELGEALIDQRQSALDFGEHALRSTILLGDAARQALERAVGV